MTGPTIEQAAAAGLVPQEWCPGGNRCMKPTNGKTGRCHNRARWCDTAAADRYDRYDFTHREPGSYAYKVCDRHALIMVGSGVYCGCLNADVAPEVDDALEDDDA